MKATLVGLVALVSFALLAQTGCATSEQWKQWSSHSTHFASGQHAAFSLRNPGETAESVKSTDPGKAQGESWWGRRLPATPGS